MRTGFFRGVLFALSIATFASVAGAVELIPLTYAVWRFNQSSNLDGVNWTAPAYDDSTWASGPSLLTIEQENRP